MASVKDENQCDIHTWYKNNNKNIEIQIVCETGLGSGPHPDHTHRATTRVPPPGGRPASIGADRGHQGAPGGTRGAVIS